MLTDEPLSNLDLKSARLLHYSTVCGARQPSSVRRSTQRLYARLRDRALIRVSRRASGLRIRKIGVAMVARQPSDSCISFPLQMASPDYLDNTQARINRGRLLGSPRDSVRCRANCNMCSTHRGCADVHNAPRSYPLHNLLRNERLAPGATHHRRNVNCVTFVEGCGGTLCSGADR